MQHNPEEFVAYRKWLQKDNNWAFYDKGDFSFGVSRDEIIEIMELRKGMDILDVGCANGLTLDSLQKKHSLNTYGVEPDKKLADEAKEHSTIYNMTVEDYLVKEDKKFDAIIMADVIEHLLEPWIVVREMGNRLKPGGFIYASIPNVMHATVLWNLFAVASFAYDSYCIVGKNHIRYFTYNDSMQLFKICGLKPVCIGAIDYKVSDEMIKLVKRLGEVFKRNDYHFEAYHFIFKVGKDD